MGVGVGEGRVKGWRWNWRAGGTGGRGARAGGDGRNSKSRRGNISRNPPLLRAAGLSRTLARSHLQQTLPLPLSILDTMVRLSAPSARLVRPTSRHAGAAATSARHASSVVPPTTPSAAAVAPATPASLRSLLQETTSALAQVDRLTKGGEGEGVWSRRLDRALARLAKDERRQLAGTAGVHGSREITRPYLLLSSALGAVQ